MKSRPDGTDLPFNRSQLNHANTFSWRHHDPSAEEKIQIAVNAWESATNTVGSDSTGWPKSIEAVVRYGEEKETARIRALIMSVTIELLY